MSKEDAIKALRKGLKIKHHYFYDKEYIYMENGKIVTEEGYKCDWLDFWVYRNSKGWRTGWSII